MVEVGAINKHLEIVMMSVHLAMPRVGHLEQLWNMLAYQKANPKRRLFHHELRMFGIPVEGSTKVSCDNESVFKNTSIPESTLKKKHMSICYHQAREAVAAGTMRVAKEGTATNLVD